MGPKPRAMPPPRHARLTLGFRQCVLRPPSEWGRHSGQDWMAQASDPEVKVSMGDAGGAKLHLLPCLRPRLASSGTPTCPDLLRAQALARPGILCPVVTPGTV